MINIKKFTFYLLVLGTIILSNTASAVSITYDNFGLGDTLIARMNDRFTENDTEFVRIVNDGTTVSISARDKEGQTYSCSFSEQSAQFYNAKTVANNFKNGSRIYVEKQVGSDVCDYLSHGIASIDLYSFTKENNDDVNKVSLVNSLTNEVIQELTNGMTISLSDVGTNLNIVAETKDGFSSIRFNSSSEGYSRNEAVAPFAYRGDTSGNFFNWNPGAGTFTLTVTPYKGSPNASEAGNPREITVFFEN